jgi:transcriptional repressor NrdR
MYCPFCSYEDTKVLESRIVENSVRRRRECSNCNNRFTTYENFIFNLVVEKKDGREEDFQRNKIKNSLIKACSKTSEEKVEEMTKRIEQRVLNEKVTKISTQEIGKIVLQELREADKVAYLRFASVHKSFDNPELFKKELNQITK